MSKRSQRQVNAVSISNTKLASCLAALGFPCDCKPLYDVKTDTTVREFLFQARSVRPEFAGLSIQIAKQYETGGLAVREPLHPLCVMMRAQHNYDRILDMHGGACMNLRSVHLHQQGQEPFAVATEYRRGSVLDPDSRFTGRVPCEDLCLVAALGGVGLPVRDFDGPEGHRRYWLPKHGYAMQKPDGEPWLADAELLIRRSPTAADPRRLELELTEPLHPVVLGYEALLSRAVLKKALLRRDPFLHLRSGTNEVIVAANHTARVMDQITERIGAPPL